MIEFTERRLELIEEDRRHLVEAFIKEVTNIIPSVERVHSLELEAFKPTGLKVKQNVLLVQVRGQSMGLLVQETYHEITEGDEIKEENLGRLVVVGDSHRLRGIIAAYSDGAARATSTVLWSPRDHLIQFPQ